MKINQALVSSYIRNAIGATFGAVMAVVAVKHYGSPLDLTAADWRAVANALWAGALPTIARYFNRDDAAFGIKK